MVHKELLQSGSEAQDNSHFQLETSRKWTGKSGPGFACAIFGPIALTAERVYKGSLPAKTQSERCQYNIKPICS